MPDVSREQLAGKIDFTWIDGDPHALASFLLELRIKKHELIAIVPRDTLNRVVVYYHIRAKPNEHQFCNNIHDLVTTLKALCDPAYRGSMARYQLDKLPPDTAITMACARLAEKLDPGMPCCHIISRDEMAAILVRAYQCGHADGQAELRAQALA